MAWIRCSGNMGGRTELKTATGSVAVFNTNLPAPVIDAKSDIDYSAKGYRSAAIINTSNTPATNKTPYLYRPSFSNGYGYETLIGGTCGVNQNCQVVEGALLENVATKTYSNGVWTFTATDLSSDSVGWYAAYSVKANHVCFIAADVNPTNNITMKLGMIDRTLFNVSGGTYTRIETLRKQDIDARPVCYAMLSGQGLGSFSFSCKNVNFIDLTQMFGTTIADYAYTLESGTSGAGITWLKNNGFFGADYYPYNSGALLSVKTSKKINTGKNFTDISDNTIAGAGYVIGGFPVAINSDNSILPSGNYVFSFDVQNATYPCACQLIWYRNGVEVGNTVETINASGINAIAFTASGKFDSIVMFCNSSSGGAFTNFNLNIGSTALPYEPYVSHEYTLDGSRKVHRIFGIVTLDGSNDEDWGNPTLLPNAFSYIDTSIKNFSGLTAVLSNSIADNAISITQNDMVDGLNGVCQFTWGNQLVFRIEGVTSVANMRNYLSVNPITVIYELATPFDETVSNPELRGVLKLDSNNNLYYYGDTCSDFTNPMIVDGNGTEEFVDVNGYAFVDLGTLDYDYYGGRFNTTSPINDLGGKMSGNYYVNVYCDKYTNSSSGNDKTFFAYNNKYLYFYDSDYTDATAFKNSLSGVILMYETVSSTGFKMPVGHETIYGEDMKARFTDFGVTVYGGSIDFTSGTLISNKNADGTDKTPETISVTPVALETRKGSNNICSNTNGNSTIKYVDYGT